MSIPYGFPDTLPDGGDTPAYTLPDGTPLVPAGRDPRKCDYCPTVYTPRAINASTCGSPECIKAYHREYSRRRHRQMMEAGTPRSAGPHRKAERLPDRPCPYCGAVYPPTSRSQTCGAKACVYAHTIRLNRERARQRRASAPAERPPAARVAPTTRAPHREPALDLTGRTRPDDAATSPWPQPKALVDRVPPASARAARRSVAAMLGAGPARLVPPAPASLFRDEAPPKPAGGPAPTSGVRDEVFPSAAVPFPAPVLAALRRAVTVPAVARAGLVIAQAINSGRYWDVVSRLAVTDGVPVDLWAEDHVLAFAKRVDGQWLARNQFGEVRL